MMLVLRLGERLVSVCNGMRAGRAWVIWSFGG
jgi:hypothetical protein